MKLLLFFVLAITGLAFNALNDAPEPKTDVRRMSLFPTDSGRQLEKEVKTLQVWCVPHLYLLAYPLWRERSVEGYLGKAFHLEAADSSLTIPENYDMIKHSLRLTGQFYNKPFCPNKVSLYGDKKYTNMINDSCVARVFRYTSIEVVY